MDRSLATSSVAAGSFDYSTSSSETVQMENVSNLSLRGTKKALAKTERECDVAMAEAQEARDTLSIVLEAIRILTKQIKSPTDHGSIPAVPTVPSLPSDLSVDLDDDASVENGNDIGKRTDSGLSVCTIASYTTNDNHRFSDLINQCSNYSDLSKVGADLIALEDACRTADQNAQWTSQESSTVLQDLHQAHAELNDLDYRCHNAERCAKKLYKENKVLKIELEKNKGERKFLIKEVKVLMDEKKQRESFQKNLLDSLKVHEDILIEHVTASKGDDKHLSAYSDETEDTIDAKEVEIDAEEETIKPSYIGFNPLGKLLSSFSGASKELDTKTGSKRDEKLVASATVTHIITPKNSVQTKSQNPLISPPLASMVEVPDFNLDVLQLTPSLSSCDSMKSVLTAQDLHDEPQETGLKPVSKRNHWKQRQVNTVSVQSSASSANPKLSVVTVKLPKKKKTNSVQSLPSPLTNKTARTFKYRQYTIS
jgi:hypothetical protein